jgi:hypothetical protein
MWVQQLFKSLMAHKWYKLMLDSACNHFPTIPRDMVTLQTNQLDVCNGHYVDITAEIWDEIIDSLTFIEVTRVSPVSLPLDAWAISLHDNRPALNRVNSGGSSYAPSFYKCFSVLKLRSCNRNDDIVTIRVVFPSGEIRSTEIPRSTRVDALVADASRMMGYCPTNIRAIWSGTIMRQDWSIGSYNIMDGDSVNLQASLRGGKPVIYLYSPSDIDVSVKLSLIPEWSLSAIYPVVTIKDHGQHIEWNVRTHQDGSLTENNSGLDVAYLFWEAE